MATVYSYHYTIDAYINWRDAAVSDNIISLIGIEGQYDESIYPDWILEHAEQSTRKSPYIIQKGFTVKWRARFYAKKVVNGGTPQYWWLNDDVVKNVKVNFNAYKDKVSNVNPAIRTDKSGVSTNFKAGKPGATYFTVQNPTGGCTFTWSVKPTQAGFKMNPAFTLSADIDLGSNYSQYGGDPDSSIKHPTLLSPFVNPAFDVYAAKPIPSLPAVFRDALDAKIDNITIAATPYAFDRCCNSWYGISITSRVAGTTAGKIYYKFRVITCDANGTNLKKGSIETENAPGNLITGVDGSKLKATRAALQKIILADCAQSKCGGGGNGSGSGNVTPPASPSGVVNPDLRWNPPPHKFSRDISFAERLYKQDLSRNNGLSSSDYGPGKIPTAADPSLVRKAFAAGERGRIFQDKAGADALNTNPDKLNLPVGLQYPKQWGFRFMYNPSSFSYSNSINNAVDWTLGSKDPATLLAGNQVVSFELFINRIVDMKYLVDYKSGQAPIVNWTQAYGRELDPAEVEGLLNRGTEYDIEFLYRVLNGDPLKNPLLFNPAYKGVTADFGYTTGVPCWLYLNENLRYYGSVAGFTVNHIMFDLNIVKNYEIEYKKLDEFIKSLQLYLQKK